MHCAAAARQAPPRYVWLCRHGADSGYLTGDRFSAEFIQRRCAELQLFLERVCRHPTLQRAKIVQQFLESSEWHIDMHAYAGQSVVPSDEAAGGASSAPPGLLESMSDMVLNAFTRVRKPDPRFVAMKAELGVEEDRTAQCERILLRNRTHVSGMYETVTPFMELAMTHACIKWPPLMNYTLLLLMPLLKTFRLITTTLQTPLSSFPCLRAA